MIFIGKSSIWMKRIKGGIILSFKSLQKTHHKHFPLKHIKRSVLKTQINIRTNHVRINKPK